VLFQLASPDQVFAPFCGEPVTRKARKDGVVGGKRARSYMEDSQSGAWRLRYRGQCDAVCHVVNWNHVNGIVDIRNKPKLNATLRKPPDEIVRIGHWIGH
jgi:hypothetical protein